MDPNPAGQIEGLAQLGSPDREHRYRTAAQLGRLGAPAVPGLRTLLRDGGLLERAAAAAGLGHTGDRGALAPLVRALRDPELAVREQAIEALGRLGMPRAYPALVWVLRTRRGAEQRLAVSALGRIGEPRAVPHLIRMLAAHPEAAAEALGRLRHIDGVGPVIKTLRTYTGIEASSEIVDACIRSLGQLRSPAAVPALCRVPDFGTGSFAAAKEALVEIGEDGIPALAEALRRAETADLAAQALLALGPSTLPHLAALTQDRERAVRTRAIALLDRLRDPRAVPTLLRLLHHEDPNTRGEAARVLGLLNVTAVAPHLHRALDDPAPPVRWRAAVSLAALGDFHLERAALLTEALEDPQEGVRVIAARALTWLARLHAAHQLRAALPALRRWGTPWRAGTLEAKDAYLAAAEAIEEATADTRSLPLSAAAGETDPTSLPRPADAPSPDPISLPRAADDA
jgi:HEAT repeat protein